MQTRAAPQPRENKAWGLRPPAEPGAWWSPRCGAGAAGIQHPASPGRKASDHGVSTVLFSGFLFCLFSAWRFLHIRGNDCLQAGVPSPPHLLPETGFILASVREALGQGQQFSFCLGSHRPAHECGGHGRGSGGLRLERGSLGAASLWPSVCPLCRRPPS